MMENEMVAEEQDMKIELGEVKVEKAEVDIESFGIVQNSLELRIEGEDDERTDRILELQRIKDEHSYVKAETNMEVLQMQGTKIKVEKNWKDCKPFKPTYITKEEIIEQDSDDEFIDGNSETGSNSGPGQVINRPHLVCKESSDELYSCYNCNYTTSSKFHLTEHMKEHKCRDSLDIQILDLTCNHPDFAELVSSRVLECTYCTYRTTLNSHFSRHMSKHSEAADGDSLCIHCKATFKSKKSLEDHTIREHPDFLSSVSNKSHKCEQGTYKTVFNSKLHRHMLVHSKSAGRHKLIILCDYCNARVTSKQKLDEHIIRKHPDSVASVSSKIYNCEYCSYQTSWKSRLTQHMNQHNKLSCRECDRKFTSRKGLDEHVIRKHPDSIASVSSKIYNCEYCLYQTSWKSRLTRHMNQHNKLSCRECDQKFNSRKGLDEHVIRKHPDSIASVSSKIHHCEYCPYQTAVKSHLTRHMNRHNKLSCRECNRRFNSRKGLDEHVIRKHPDSIASVSSKIHHCEYCPYQTAVKSHLTRHMNQHNKLSCRECDRKFNSRKGLDEHVIRKHPDSIASVSSKIHHCEYCPYQTVVKSHLTRHMNRHNKLSCRECNRRFNRRTGLDEHIIRKHPDSIASVSSKIYNCEYCLYQTSWKSHLTEHMNQHNKLSCRECDRKFNSRKGLDEHVIRKHPHCIASVSSKLHECAQCSHMLVHSKSAGRRKLVILCDYCNLTFKRKRNLDDHIIRQHPDSIASVSSKIHHCEYCPYQTAVKSHLTEHMNQHNKLSCRECDRKFTSRKGLDEHVIRKHPDSIASVSSKIHKCTYCAFQTVLKHLFNRHMLKHHANQTQVISRVEEISSEND